MKKSFQGKAASKKPNNWIRSSFVQLKEALHVLLEMASKQSNLLGGENEGTKTRVKDWDPIQVFNTNR